jgi:hypothetical protein
VQDAFTTARRVQSRAAVKKSGPYLASLKLNNGLVGCSFFDFFNAFFAFLAIFFSLARFAQLGTGVLICKALAKVHIHFFAPQKPVFVGFLAIPPLQPGSVGSPPVEFLQSLLRISTRFCRAHPRNRIFRHAARVFSDCSRRPCACDH